ncbi:MFS transporter [Gordonia sp. DT219]|uniref:MFS transporter n=1 Tax=Gordonia sp. DT219 TaxID=3416658 RepID=UPI003CEED1F3
MNSAVTEGASSWKIFIHSLNHSPGLGRLLAVRLTSQLTDGVFQAALIGGVLFNPERHADPLAAALGFAVLLLPYSVIGPFAGALLDRWDRRNVLLWANVLRAVLIGLVAVAMATGGSDTLVLISALTVTGASRFVASGLSAALPHVAHREVIVATNALFTTLGGAMLSVGAGLTLGVRALVGNDNVGSAETILIGVVLALVAGLVAHGFPVLQLGPDRADDPGHSAAHAVAVGFVHGARAIIRCRPAAAALSAIGVHRFIFGVNTLTLFVFARHVDGGGDGLSRISLVLGCVAAGAFVAAFTTPILVARFGRRATLVAMLALGALAQLLLLTFTIQGFCTAAIGLGLVGQTTKLCGDVAMQVDIDDTVRGQVFSAQDALFNVAYVLAMVLTALVIGPQGRSVTLVLIGCGFYLVGIVVVRAVHPPGRDRQPGPFAEDHLPKPGAPSA